MDMRAKTCCFTGHRSLSVAEKLKVAVRLRKVIREFVKQGIVFYGAGGALGFDTLAAQTVLVDGVGVDLTSYEYKVLEYLMLHAGELVSKADLTEHIYQQDFDRDSNVLEVFIGRLRRKLDPDNALKPIETVRGRGYRFAIPRSEGGHEPADEAAAK